MQETLHIENFGPIENATLDLREVMVLIGPQSSGKSTIAKLISIIKDARFVTQRKSFEDLISEFNLSSFITDNTFIKYSSDGYQFQLIKKVTTFSLNESHQLLSQYEELIAKSQIPRIENEKITLGHIYNAAKYNLDEQQDLSQKIGDEIQAKELLIAAEKNKKKNNQLKAELLKLYLNSTEKIKAYTEVLQRQTSMLESLASFASYSIYIPAERILISLYADAIFSFLNSDLNVPKTVLKFGTLFQTAKNTIAQLPIFENFVYSNENGEDFVYYNDVEKMKLSDSSSGIQALLPLFIVVNHFSKDSDVGVLNSFIVEEPEQNIYPKTQKDLVYFLSGKRGVIASEQKRTGLIITTHSPYTLTSFNNLLFAYKVSKKTKGIDSEVNQIIAKESWINPYEFNAYYIAGKTAKEIFNRETGLIDENELDSASEEIMNDFDQLMDIYKGIKP